MKITQVLFKQHLGRHFKKHWQVQGKKIPAESGAAKILQAKGIPVYEPDDIFEEVREYEKVEVIGIGPQPVKFDDTHPNWHDRVCLVYRDDNVLLEGLNQAKLLTKTVEVKEGLPEKFELKTIKGVNKRVKQIILGSHLFDAEQQKLPKVRDPLRPAWNFPRTYGITEQRINKLMVSKLLQLLELVGDSNLPKQRAVLNELRFSYPFEKDGNLIQFELTGDTLLTASKPLEPVTSVDTTALDLPDLFPLKETITLNLENIYEIRNLYPIDSNIPKSHPHTVFVHYNAAEVRNLYEEEVTEEQVFGRSLLKTFTIAASYAKQRYGDDAKSLPNPVTLQCVQTDGRQFHFGVLQLNTLDVEGRTGPKNVWYQTSRLPLFASCSYVLGRPALEGYNGDVIKHLSSFYHNI